MNTTEKVIQVLNSREAERINFTAASISITGGTVFKAIANDLGGLSPSRFITVSSSFSGGAAALYHPTTNTFEVAEDRVGSRVWAGLVIHEAVHAWIDRNSLTPTAVDNEAVSYIAQAIYYRRTGLARSRTPNPIYLAARDIANSILQGSGVSAAPLQTLRDLILGSPTYSHLNSTMSYASDG